MIFGRYILRAPKQRIERTHICLPPMAYDQGPGTLWKCWRCKQVWEYTGEWPYVVVRKVER